MNNEQLHTQAYTSTERVGFPRRFAAVMLDNFIVAIVATLLALTVGHSILALIGADDDDIEFNIFTENADSDGGGNAGSKNNGDTINDELGSTPAFLGVSGRTIAALTALNSLVMLAYSVLELLTGASLGKRALGIVIGFDDGAPFTRTLLLRRWFLKYGAYAMVLIPAIATIGSIWNFLFTCGFLLSIGAQRQGLHDMAVHSAVYFRNEIRS
jgi:hypothetical protein